MRIQVVFVILSYAGRQMCLEPLKRGLPLKKLAGIKKTAHSKKPREMPVQPLSRPSTIALGTKIRKFFLGFGAYAGTVVEILRVAEKKRFRVLYEDGGVEDLNQAEIADLVVSTPTATLNHVLLRTPSTTDIGTKRNAAVFMEESKGADLV